MNTPLVDLSEGDRICRAVTRHHAKTFYFASASLSRSCRTHAYRVYGFCRWVDNLVDDEPDPALAAGRIAQARGLLADVYDGRVKAPALLAFQATVRERGIPREHFLDLLDGMEMDLVKNRYENFDELELYCHRVAGVVGYIMARIFGFRDERCLPQARALGIAMQLTNILRDVKEDAERGRIYLARDERLKFGLDDASIFEGRVDEPYREFMRGQIARARAYYREAYEGVPDLFGLTNRLCVRLMGRLYGEILDVIEANELDVYRGRASVPFSRKLVVLMNAQLGLAADAARSFWTEPTPLGASTRP